MSVRRGTGAGTEVRATIGQVLDSNAIMGGISANAQGIQAINNVLDGVTVVQITGDLLTRAINGTTQIARSLLPSGAVLVQNKTLLGDAEGAVGLYTGDATPSVIIVRTLTVSPVYGYEGVLLGVVATFAALPPDVASAETLFGATPVVTDWVRIMSDEGPDGNNATTERDIIDIGPGGAITYGVPIPLNTADYQEQTTTADAGLVLTGGADAGTFGTSLDVDTVPTQSSSNLITSGAVWGLYSQISGLEMRNIAPVITDYTPPPTISVLGLNVVNQVIITPRVWGIINFTSSTAINPVQVGPGLYIGSIMLSMSPLTIKTGYFWKEKTQNGRFYVLFDEGFTITTGAKPVSLYALAVESQYESTKNLPYTLVANQMSQALYIADSSNNLVGNALTNSDFKAIFGQLGINNIPAANNSSTAGTGFGGFRYTTSGTPGGSDYELNLFTT